METIGGLTITVLLFGIAVFLCFTLNFVMIKASWDVVPEWVKRATFLCAVATIFAVVYLLVARLWGAA